MSKLKKILKKTVVAFTVATTLASIAAPSAEAYWLSSAQERNLGWDAASDYQKKHNCHEHPILTHIQDRLMEYNTSKLWMYSNRPSWSKRGLSRVLLSEDDNHINAMSYGGGFIYVYQGMMDFLSMHSLSLGFSCAKDNYLPWKTCNLYQMSSLATCLGHEMAHWANEDMLRHVDSQLKTLGLISLIPVANIYTALGVGMAGRVVNMLNSRALGFEMERQADARGMEFVEPVPEYSIGGEAIEQYRSILLLQPSKSFNNWLHPHSTAEKRLERALDIIRLTSKGFFSWKGIDLYMDGERWAPITINNEWIVLPHRDFGEWHDRTFYVVGQLASAIKYDIASMDNLSYYRENEIFPDSGSRDHTVAILPGKDRYGNVRKKVVDSYHMPKDQLLQYAKNLDKKWDDDFQGALIGLSDNRRNDVVSLVITWKMLRKWEERKYHYIAHQYELRPIADDDSQEEEPGIGD